MTIYRADWVLPISDAPRANTWISVESGRVTGVGEAEEGAPAGATDLGHVAILPGLVNAHTHLELSHLHRVIPPSTSFLDWIGHVIRLRREFPDPQDARIIAAARDAIRQARAAGTALVGDISNTLVTHPLLSETGLAAVVFYELLGFKNLDPAAIVADARARIAGLAPSPDVRVTLAAHAPYSVSPGLFRAIREDLDREDGGLSSVHLGESVDEVEFILRGSGPLRAQLESMGVWVEDWPIPGCTSSEYLERLGFLDGRMLAVHGVQFTGSDLDRLRACGATVVSCPRSNVHVGAGSPPLEAFYAMDVRVAFGTDSLASVDDLNMFAELAEARRIAPRATAGRLLESATLAGARALGFDTELGSLDVGKRASVITVQVPTGVDDVEEYLVSGIAPRDVRWLDE